MESESLVDVSFSLNLLELIRPPNLDDRVQTRKNRAVTSTHQVSAAKTTRPVCDPFRIAHRKRRCRRALLLTICAGEVR